MIISVDTKHDSLDDIKRAIVMLENFIKEQGSEASEDSLQAANTTQTSFSQNQSESIASHATETLLPLSEPVSAQMPEAAPLQQDTSPSFDASTFEVEQPEAPTSSMNEQKEEAAPDFSDLFNDITVAQAVQGSASSQTEAKPSSKNSDEELFSELFSKEDMPEEEEEDEDEFLPSQKPKIEFYR